jgi:hypothetical protein
MQEVGKMATDNLTKFDREAYQQKLVEQGYTLEQAVMIAEKYERAPKSKPETNDSQTVESKVTGSIAPATPVTKCLSDHIAESLALDEEEARQAGAIGYMARAMVQATMPHSKPSDFHFLRRNGKFMLSMSANPQIGLPFGVLPRLILSWITSEVVRKKEQTLSLGSSMSEFMGALGLTVTGGTKGSIGRFKNHMMRLFTTGISCTYEDEKEISGLNFYIADRYHLWWTPKTPDQLSLWDSEIKLSQRFFEEIMKAPVPVRLQTLAELKTSSMALDIYCWLTYRNFYAQRPSRIPWEALQMQFGAGYPDTAQGKRDFKKNFLLALKKVGVAYPEAQKLRAETDYLLYVPGYPDVSPVVPKET